eukprot:365251-Chlamydomonas_euryale.AAC.10
MVAVLNRHPKPEGPQQWPRLEIRAKQIRAKQIVPCAQMSRGLGPRLVLRHLLRASQSLWGCAGGGSHLAPARSSFDGHCEHDIAQVELQRHAANARAANARAAERL